MEKVLAFNLDEIRLNQVYKICSQMKVTVIAVEKSEMMVPLKRLLDKHPYRGNVVGLLAASAEQRTSADAAEQTEGSLLVMCELTQKHIDRLLASIRLCNIAIDFKAVLTSVNTEWNGMRMLVEMAAEKRAIEGKAYESTLHK